MAISTKMILRNGWHRLKVGTKLARGLGPRVDVRGATEFLRRGLSDLLFPPACVSCKAEMEAGGPPGIVVPVCDDCLQAMELFAEPMCVRCGAPLPPGASKSRGDCFRCAGQRKLWFDETVALGLYDGKLRDLVLRMKQSAGDAVSLAMGQFLFEQRAARLVEIGADVVAPIPLHWRRRVVHRTNSAAVVAEILAGRMRVPLAERLLRRTRSTARQFDLTPPERWKNVRGAFSVRAGYHLREAHVLLVDDVLTTGATCSEAARALRRAGAERVTVAVIARAMG